MTRAVQGGRIRIVGVGTVCKGRVGEGVKACFACEGVAAWWRCFHLGSDAKCSVGRRSDERWW